MCMPYIRNQHQQPKPQPEKPRYCTRWTILPFSSSLMYNLDILLLRLVRGVGRFLVRFLRYQVKRANCILFNLINNERRLLNSFFRILIKVMSFLLGEMQLNRVLEYKELIIKLMRYFQMYLTLGRPSTTQNKSSKSMVKSAASPHAQSRCRKHAISYENKNSRKYKQSSASAASSKFMDRSRSIWKGYRERRRQIPAVEVFITIVVIRDILLLLYLADPMLQAMDLIINEFILKILQIYIVDHLFMQLTKQTTKQSVISSTLSTHSQKVNYVQCQKSGLHFGQVCNMVCIQPSCLEDLVCCCACIQQSHKKHITKPLKMIMNQAKHQSQLIKPTNFNIDVILDIINTTQKQAIQTFQNYKKEIMGSLDQIQKSLLGYYNSISQQIKLKNTDPKAEVSTAFDEISKATNTDDLKIWVKKIVAMIPNNDKENQMCTDITEQQLIDILKTRNTQINQMMSNNVLEVKNKLKDYKKGLQQAVNKTNIWKAPAKYKFSPTFKHNDIKLITDYHIKSQNTSGYKFAVMEPNLQKGNANKTFHFKIKQCNSNWIAIGMCHKNIVASKNYTFNFSTLGHGGYMISANGGTWSNNNQQFNNKVKAFKFVKGDVITAVVNLKQSKITFKKKAESFDIPFSTINGDELHPCVLFYYVNDEVEYLPDHKE